MELLAVCAMELTARGDVAAVARFGTGEGCEFEQGEAVVTGERLNGTAKYSQRLERRSDGAVEVRIAGTVATADGALVMWRASGRERADGRGLLVASMEAQDERYRWLNELVLVGEAVFEADHLHAHIAFSSYEPAG